MVVILYPAPCVGDDVLINMVSVLTAHYDDVIMGAIASQITSLTIVHSTVYSDADQRKYQSAASLAFVRGIHRGPVNSPHKWPVTRKLFPFDGVIMQMTGHSLVITVGLSKIILSFSPTSYFILFHFIAY